MIDNYYQKQVYASTLVGHRGAYSHPDELTSS